MNFVDVGYNSFVNVDKIIGVSGYDSQPIKMFVKEAKKEGRYLELTKGRTTRSIIHTVSDNTILLISSTLSTVSLHNRIEKAKADND